MRRFIFAQPFEIVEDRGDEFLPSRIQTRWARCENLEQVARLAGGLRPGRGRGNKKLVFEVRLTRPQVLLVRLDLGRKPANVGCLLRGHAAVAVEVYRWFVDHWLCSALSRSLASSSALSSMFWLTPIRPGTWGRYITAEIRRYAGYIRSPTGSSSVVTSYRPGSTGESSPVNKTGCFSVTTTCLTRFIIPRVATFRRALPRLAEVVISPSGPAKIDGNDAGTMRPEA